MIIRGIGPIRNGLIAIMHWGIVPFEAWLNLTRSGRIGSFGNDPITVIAVLPEELDPLGA